MKFKTYNPGKITQYGLLVRMVCEAVLGYICTTKTCTAEGKKLETVLSVCKSLTNQCNFEHLLKWINNYAKIILYYIKITFNMMHKCLTFQIFRRRGYGFYYQFIAVSFL
jgi:hypothetical protein